MSLAVEVTPMWDNRDAPGGATNTLRGLTHSSDYGREGLAMKATRACSVEGCEADAYSLGYCVKHYHRVRRTGSPDGPKRVASCAVEGCDKTGKFVLGMCILHYHRFKRHGSTEPPPPRTRSGLIDLTGVRFGRLVVLGEAERVWDASGHALRRWKCVCECGSIAVVGHKGLRGGQVTSCGCLVLERRSDAGYSAAHLRAQTDRGKASEHACVDCGKPAIDWSYDHNDPDELLGPPKPGKPLAAYSLNPEFYSPRCRPCHRAFDAPRRRTVAP